MNQLRGDTTKPEMTMELDALFDKVSSGIVECLNLVKYPRRPLYFEIQQFLTIEIRMPPSLLPDAVRELGIRGAMRAFPSIEVIRITPELQGRGLFTRIVQALAQSPDVRAVVVSNVENQEFAKKLSERCQQPGANWRPYDGGYLPSFAYWKDLSICR